MILATDNVGNHRQMNIISCMNIPKQSQFVQKNEKLFYDVHKWRDDVEVEQVVLKNSFLIWEMHQSDWEKL